ncbi:MAG: 4-hydroxy-tetrahydrodipicolinate synthase [Endomicrobiales bacterium]|nr:4-hydroxy-tetrahydrodipicolinate synthase [Endomicrobiales bacterium]
MFEGSYVALVTPFKNGAVDFDKLKEIIEFQIENGTAGIVPCGTTGESATLSMEEHEAVIEATVKVVNKRVKVMAGTGANCTDEAIALTKFAQKVGCDAALLVSPYYNKPTQKGLFLHYKAISESTNIPLVLYNIMGRTAVNIEVETTAKIVKQCKTVVGVKEASGSLEQMALTKLACPDINLISGDDALTLPVLSIGGVGVISVVANIVPKAVSELVEHFLAGRFAQAKELHYKLLPLVKAMFIETNPIPVKTAMAMLGMCSDEFRLPMCSMEDANKAKLEIALKNYGLL